MEPRQTEPRAHATPDERAAFTDLLELDTDPRFAGLIHDLNATFTSMRPPQRLAAMPTPPTPQTPAQRDGIRTAWGRATRFGTRPQGRLLPRSLGRAIAAAMVATLLLVGVAYAGGTLLDRVFGMDPGTQQLLQSNLYETIGASHTFGDATLTVERAYADANRVIVGYSLTSATGGPPPTPSQVELRLTTGDGLALPVFGGAGYREPTSQEADVISFDAAGISGTPTNVPLHLEVLTQTGDTWGLDFTLPFHPGRVIHPHQSLTVNGGTATLEKVVLTPSEMRIYLSGVGERFTSHLSIGNWLNGWDSDRGPVGAITTWTTPDGLSAVSFLAALYGQHGQWTLQVSLTGNAVAAQPTNAGTSQSTNAGTSQSTNAGTSQSTNDKPTNGGQLAAATGGPWTFTFTIP